MDKRGQRELLKCLHFKQSLGHVQGDWVNCPSCTVQKCLPVQALCLCHSQTWGLLQLAAAVRAWACPISNPPSSSPASLNFSKNFAPFTNNHIPANCISSEHPESLSRETHRKRCVLLCVLLIPCSSHQLRLPTGQGENLPPPHGAPAHTSQSRCSHLEPHHNNSVPGT